MNAAPVLLPVLAEMRSAPLVYLGVTVDALVELLPISISRV